MSKVIARATLGSALLIAACSDSVASDGGSYATSGSDGDSGSESDGGSTGYVDQVPCDARSCGNFEDCCKDWDEDAQEWKDLYYGECGPTAPYVNRWACVGNTCVHGGCASDTECWLPGLPVVTWQCHNIGGKGFCIQPCSIDADCPSKMGDAPGKTKCIGVTDTTARFCAEEPINP